MCIVCSWKIIVVLCVTQINCHLELRFHLQRGLCVDHDCSSCNLTLWKHKPIQWLVCWILIVALYLSLLSVFIGCKGVVVANIQVTSYRLCKPRNWAHKAWEGRSLSWFTVPAFEHDGVPMVIRCLVSSSVIMSGGNVDTMEIIICILYLYSNTRPCACTLAAICVPCAASNIPSKLREMLFTWFFT